MNKSKHKFSLADQRLYPHLKITREKFPRLLVTRQIADDDAEYFGAFLPETGVRFLIDFLNKIFKLRGCEIAIDGSFDVPCTQFYRKRCLAPCVENLCGKTEYLAQVELVRLFLRRNTSELEKRFLQKIENFAADLDFETAKYWRDDWLAIEKLFTAKDWNFWLDDAVDNFEVEESEGNFIVYLVTMRGRKTLGRRVLIFEKSGKIEDVLPEILPQFYRFHVPKEIRASVDFKDRFLIADELSKKFNRQIKITVVNKNQPKVLTNHAIDRTKYEHELRNIKSEKSAAEISTEIKNIFNLSKKPTRIEGFDVAHIAGENFVAAKSVWENGKFPGKEYSFWFSDEASELETLQKFVEFHFARNVEKYPDLILIDGGWSQLQAALKGLENLPDRKFQIISAVKPPRQHSEIAYFLTETNQRINFDGASAAHRVLQNLRDEAHNLSNEIHRQRREMAHFYTLAEMLPSLDEKERREFLKAFGSIKNILASNKGDLEKLFAPAQTDLIWRDLESYKSGKTVKIEPLIVPLRFDDENGDARDLRPLANYRAL